jgi:translation initiation factor 3 subunit F
VSGSDALIQDYFSHQCSNPVHLTVDTGLSNQRMAVAAYVARALTLGGRPEPLATQFQEVPCEVQTVAVEKIGSAPPTLPGHGPSS